MKKTRKRLHHFSLILCLLLLCSFLLSACGSPAASVKKETLDPQNPTLVTIWHYYNGAQLEAFNALIKEFNETAGKEQGIIVEGYSQGNVTDLESSVLDSVNHKVGASELPSIFAAYADTAYAVDQLGYAVDLKPYLTQEEIDQFVGSYIQEGEFSSDGSLKIFPIAKSTEIFILNQTDWDKFADATGATTDDFSTIEGLTATAQAYYEWTDSLTPEPNDGKAFFGRDAIANYFLIGAKQLGVELFSVQDGKPVLHFDQAVVRKIWDNYYIPFIKGYFSASGRFRSDDIKTGNIISFVGSSSGASFFPKEVISSDTESYPIEMMVLPCPQFEGGEKYAVQQGAGMVVTKTDDQQIYASIQFLKWFIADERNIQFSVASGYMPVTKSANQIDAIKNTLTSESDTTLSIVTAAIDTVNNNTLYTTKAFENGTSARNILEYSMSDLAAADREIVIERLSSGMSLEEAVQSFATDEYFLSWYEKTKTDLEALVK